MRCPLHHACFSLRTGEALRAPAFDKIDCWRTEQVGDTVFVRERLTQPQTSPSGVGGKLKSIVIVGEVPQRSQQQKCCVVSDMMDV